MSVGVGEGLGATGKQRGLIQGLLVVVLTVKRVMYDNWRHVSLWGLL